MSQGGALYSTVVVGFGLFKTRPALLGNLRSTTIRISAHSVVAHYIQYSLPDIACRKGLD